MSKFYSFIIFFTGRFDPKCVLVPSLRLGARGLYRAQGRPLSACATFTAAAVPALRHAVEVVVHFWIQGKNVERMLFYLVPSGRWSGREEREEDEVGDRLCSPSVLTPSSGGQQEPLCQEGVTSGVCEGPPVPGCLSSALNTIVAALSPPPASCLTLFYLSSATTPYLTSTAYCPLSHNTPPTYPSPNLFEPPSVLWLVQWQSVRLPF